MMYFDGRRRWDLNFEAGILQNKRTRRSSTSKRIAPSSRQSSNISICAWQSSLAVWGSS